MKLQFSGAYNPLCLIRNDELIEAKGDKMPIGIFLREKESFTNNDFTMEKGTCYYIFSDGYVDQLGGEKTRKYMSKNFKEKLLEIHSKPMAEQQILLDKEITQWQGKNEQVDDMLVIGFRY